MALTQLQATMKWLWIVVISACKNGIVGEGNSMDTTTKYSTGKYTGQICAFYNELMRSLFNFHVRDLRAGGH